MPSPYNITNIPAPRVDFIDPRTGLMAREWYRFFFNLFNLTGAGTTDTSLADLQMGPPAINAVIGELGITYDQAQLASMMAQYEQSVRDVINRIEAMPAPPQLGTMAQLQQAWLPWVTFDTAPEFTPPDVGTVAWDGGTTLGVQMTTNVLGRVNESAYYYIKASSAITKGEVIMFTGAVGASGVPTGAPATGVTDGSYIMGIAAESIALNNFGLVQFAGTLKGVNTSSFLDGDILWYDPSVVGGLTKTKPTAPNVKVQMAAVINAGGGGSGSILIRVNAGSVLGGTDSNVQFGTLANKDLIQYDSTAQYWKNVAASSISIGTATNLAGGAAGSVPYQSGAGATTFLSIGTAGQYARVNAGATAPEWANPAALTKTDDTNVTLTLGGSASTALLNAASITVGWTGTLAVSRGGTGASTASITSFNNITGYTATGATGTTSTNLVFSGSPTIATPTITTSATVPLLIGGTGTTSTLTLRSTSGVGTTGADVIIQSGNNGDKEGIRVDVNGNVGIAGQTAPSTPLATGTWGNGLAVGTTSATYGLVIVSSSASTLSALRFGNGTTGLYDQGFVAYNHSINRLAFGTNRSTRVVIDSTGNLLSISTGGIGYGTGSGGAVTQATSRTTGVTLDKTNGAITLVSAAGTTTWQTFTVTNSSVAATDTIIVNQKSGTDLYQIFVTNVAAGSFKITFATTGGTTTEQPVFNFAVIKAVTA